MGACSLSLSQILRKQKARPSMCGCLSRSRFSKGQIVHVDLIFEVNHHRQISPVRFGFIIFPCLTLILQCKPQSSQLQYLVLGRHSPPDLNCNSNSRQNIWIIIYIWKANLKLACEQSCKSHKNKLKHPCCEKHLVFNSPKTWLIIYLQRITLNVEKWV